jgi:phosphopantothenoylcysteine decarboxylase/phosphopantothenate--cysteine ligase
MRLQSKKIVLGITGGIAAYKTPELVRQLTQEGAAVEVVMTRSARQFVTTTTLQAVSGRRVHDDLWDAAAEAAMGHIELARWADCVLIAPATAHCIARLASGTADDLLTTLCLATTSPVAVAPAMNQQMWQHRATQRNLSQLVSDGVRILGPGHGAQACGEFGPGRMLEPEELCAEIVALFGPRVLQGRRVVVTAGPTREPIDPVRYISNHSSGKQGFELAKAARNAGADVTLIAGPVTLPTPPGVRRIDVVTALDMDEAVRAHLQACDIFIGVAAVADYRPAHAATDKIKKHGDAGLSLQLVQNPDIIASVAKRKMRPFVVGFAAETAASGLTNARTKLARKGLDMIVLNDVSDRRIGFNSDDNAVTVITRDSDERLSIGAKSAISYALIERIAAAFEKRSADQGIGGTAG